MSAATDKGSLLLVTNNRSRVFQRSIIAGAEQVGTERGYRIEVLESPEPTPSPALIRRLERNEAGVLLVADVLPDPIVARLHARGTTISLASHRIPRVEVPAIMHDNRQGVSLLAAEAFDRRGRSAPVFIGGSLRQQDGVQRTLAFRRELMRRGLPLEESRFLNGGFEPDQAAAALADFLDSGGDLDSLISADYLMAIACLPVLAERGRRVPENVSVLGFGDGPESEAAGLTTASADVVELGRRGARQLVGQLEGLNIRGLTLLSTSLRVRHTSSPPPT